MRLLLVGTLLLGCGAAHANDTMAQLGTGGLVFVTNDNIEMASEALSISPTEVKVVYEFNNTAEQAQDILVAFPMPDIKGDVDFMTSVPSDNTERSGDRDNLFGFETTFNGVPVDAELHQYVFNNNIDYTKLLRQLGVPLEPFGDETRQALAELDQDDADKLVRLGLVTAIEYDAGNGTEIDLTPIWTLRSTYSWEATFEPGVSEVVHSYTPSVGGTVATIFMPTAKGGFSDDYLADYQRKYCVDDGLINAVARQGQRQDGYTNFPFYENWISYIWSTGNNWAGPIKDFTLTIDKGDADNLLSFCGENVTKIGPTTFQMKATDWFPPEQELEILLLVKQDPVP